MHHPTDRITHTTAFVTPVVELLAGTRNTSMVPPRRIDPTTHRTMSESTHHGATSRSLHHQSQLGCSATSYSATSASSCSLSLMVRWVVGSILHGVDPLSYFSFQPVIHDWCNKGRGMVILSVGWCI